MEYSLGGKILDIFDDPGMKLLATSPYFDKVASFPMGDPEKLSTVDDRKFGVIFVTKTGEFIRKYPLHDQTHTVLSNIYFEMCHDKLPPEAKVAAATQILEASKLYGANPLPAVMEFAAEEPLEGQHYVYLSKVATPSELGPVDVFKSLQDQYALNAHHYGREDKRELAQEMAPISEKFGFEIPKDLRPFCLKEASLNKEALFEQCSLRKELTRGRYEASGLMDELLMKQADFAPGEVVKLLEAFDKQFGLESYWDKGMEPERVLAEKVAYHNSPVRGMGGFSQDELNGFVSKNGELLQKMFGEDFSKRVQDDPGLIWTLPSVSREFIMARIEHGRENTPVEAQ